MSWLPWFGLGYVLGVWYVIALVWFGAHKVMPAARRG